MTIALLTDGLFPFTLGGIQKHSYYLTKYWAKQGVQVHVYHPNQYKPEELEKFFTEEELTRIEFIYVPHPSSIRFFGHYIYNSYRYSKALFKAVHQDNYDAIYAQGFTGWYFLQKEPFNKRMVTNLHGLEMYQAAINAKTKLKHYLLRLAAGPIIRHSNKQISLGGKLTALLYQQGAKASSVYEVPNAISPEWLKETQPVSVQPNPTESTDLSALKGLKRFIFIGRYERRKGIEETNTVLKQLMDDGQHFECHFIGPIPNKKKVQGQRYRVKGKPPLKPQTLNPNPNDTSETPNPTPNTQDPKPYNLYPITYWGTITDQQKIQQLLNESDVLLCPSYSEGMPTVILEAMACNCAIIATNVGASGELVNQENGWLIERDIVSGLKKAMKEAIDIDDEQLNKMKKQSLLKVKEKYTWDVIARQSLEVFRK